MSCLRKSKLIWQTSWISLPTISRPRPHSRASVLILLDTVEMVMDLEEQLGVDLELEEKLATVGELVDFVESKLD